MAEISSSLEDYIEAVYSIYTKDNKVKAIDVARRLNVSRASVTEEGVKKAKEVIKKHETLSEFFENILGVEHSLAEETACKIEHVIDNRILKKLEQHIKNYRLK